MKTYRIGELYGGAWEAAVVNVGNILGMEAENAQNSWVRIEQIASKLGVCFDINGEVVADRGLA